MSEINKRITHVDILESKTDGKKTWNVQALRTKIRELTKEANLILLENEDRADYRQLAARIIEASRVERKNKKGEIIKPKNPNIFVGDLNFKNTEELEIQLQGLQQFLEYDKLSSEAKKKQQQRFEKAKASYESTIGHEVSAGEFEKTVQRFTILNTLSAGYDSESIRELAEAARKQGIKINISSALQKAENYAKEHDILATPENIFDIVYSQNGIKRK